MDSKIREFVVGQVEISLSSDYLGQYETAELKKLHIKLKTDIDNNDARLTAGSSADLDYSLEKLKAIEEELSKRINEDQQ